MLRRLRSPEASSRGSSSVIFSCVISSSSCDGTLFIGFPMAFCLSKSLVFSSSKPKSSSPRFHSSHLFVPLAQFPGSSSTAYMNDATFEPVVRTWVTRRICRLVSSDWIPPPLPCVRDSGSLQVGHHRYFAFTGKLNAPLTGNPISASRPIFHPLMCFWVICNAPGHDSTLNAVTKWCSDSSISSDCKLHILEKNPNAAAIFTVALE